jgi:glycerophosphoryl diester phosphodiesterase
MAITWTVERGEEEMRRIDAGVLQVRPASQPRRRSQILRIAHRGGHNGSEGYSPANLQHVAALGATMVEFDLHVTGDHRFVVTHDPRVRSRSGQDLWLVEHSLPELIDLTGASNLLPVEAVLQAARDASLGIYVDLKTMTRTAMDYLVHAIDDLHLADSTILASVRSDIVRDCSLWAPTIPRAVLFASTLEEPVQLAASSAADFVHPCWEVQPRPDALLAGDWIERVRGHGRGVICWHEERADVLERLCDLGVDGICTDDPALLTAVAIGDQK